MTEDEHLRDIGRAVKRHAEIRQKVACLKRRLETFQIALMTFVAQPRHADAAFVVDEAASDPRQDATNLLKFLDEQDRLREFLKEHGIDI